MPRFTIMSMVLLVGITAAFLAMVRLYRNGEPWLAPIPLAIYGVMIVAWFIHARINEDKIL